MVIPVMKAEQQRLAENKPPDEPWHFWDRICRARVGHGPRGLQRERRRLELLSARSRRSRAYRWNEDASAAFPITKGRLCFAFRVLERARSVFEGTHLGVTARKEITAKT